MTRAQWQIAVRITALLVLEVGMTDRQLATELGRTMGELRPVTGKMIGTGRVDRYAGYPVLPLSAQTRERAA